MVYLGLILGIGHIGFGYKTVDIHMMLLALAAIANHQIAVILACGPSGDGDHLTVFYFPYLAAGGNGKAPAENYFSVLQGSVSFAGSFSQNRF